MLPSKCELNTIIKELQFDEQTVVSIYQKIREHHPQSILLEGADYIPDSNSFSYIACSPIAELRLENNNLLAQIGDRFFKKELRTNAEVIEELKSFKNCFSNNIQLPKGCINGLLGYISYDAIRYFETLSYKINDESPIQIPELLYFVFRWIICIDHYHNKAYLVGNFLKDEMLDSALEVERFLKQLQPEVSQIGFFEKSGTESSTLTDEQHLDLIAKCQQHIARGDVFQIVASRQFSQAYRGDDFEVYRALRKINPSPYMFYFDSGAFRIFGSSPEAEIIVSKMEAELHPIAGTVLRSGNEAQDLAKAQELLEDPKENAEHVMLVDLARNDLSRHCEEVTVATFREIQTYSHVIHLVSKVVGKLASEQDCINLLIDTFPAGTLSGAPKFKAMELLNKYEPQQRSCYGGTIGYLGFDNTCKHAIIIRSFLSKNSVLYYQAGAGIVADSKPEAEVQEVRNKLMALGKAINAAGK